MEIWHRQYAKSRAKKNREEERIITFYIKQVTGVPIGMNVREYTTMGTPAVCTMQEVK